MAAGWLSNPNFSPTDSLHADDMNNLANDIRVWGGDVNGGGHHLANVIIDNYFPGAGYPLLSPIHVIPTSTDYTAQVRLDSEAANNPARWVINKDAATESGANAGSNFQIVRCADDGSSIDAPIAINRASGVITLGAQQWAGNINGGGFTLTNVVIPSVFQDPTQAKGDLVASQGSGLVRFPLGGTPDGMVLITDSTTQFGIKWGQSPAVPLTRKINTGAVATTGLSGGGPLTTDLNLSAAVVTVFGRTGNVVLQSSDLTGAGGVPNTFTIQAGAGMSGGGPLTGSSVTLNANVVSVMGHSAATDAPGGVVTLNQTDVIAMGGVPASRLVKAGSGMVPTSGGNLSSDITLSALVTSVFGGIGDVVLTGPIISAAGGVLKTQHVATGYGLTGGGQLTGDMTLSVVDSTSVQKIYFAQQGSIQPTPRSTINFVQGPNKNINVVCSDDAALNAVDVSIDAIGTIGIWLNGTLQSNQYNAINFIEGTGIVITPTANSSANFGAGWVDVTISATGTGSGGGSVSQSPWTTPIDAAGNYLGNVSFIGVNRTADFASPPTSANARVAIQVNGPEIGLRAAQASSAQIAIIEADNDNGTAKVALKAYGSQFNTPPGTSLKATSGLDALAGPMTFAVAGSEAARISLGKRMLIGTSVDDGNNMLQVNGSMKILPTGSGIIFPDGTIQVTAGGGALQDPTTTKGDLIVHNAAIGTTRLPVGTTNGMVLTADSTVSNGVSWQSGAGQSPWKSNIDAANFELHGAANIGIGAYTIPVTNLVTGRRYLTVLGNQAAGVVELANSAADADATLIGEIAWSFPTNSSTDKRIAVIDAFSSGTTANNRGSYMSFFTKPDGGVLAERMRITNQGYVGIGTTGPTSTLQVAADTYRQLYLSASSLLANQMRLGYDTSNNTGVVEVMNSGGARPLLLNPSGGNVGIGTTTPGSLLHVVSGSSGLVNVAFLESQYISVNDGTGLVFRGGGVNYSRIRSVVEGAAAVGLAFDTSNSLAERMRITNGGLVGIGTVSPSYPLDVETTGTSDSVKIGNAQSMMILGGGDGNAAHINCPSWALSLQTNATNRIYILNNGQVGIGATPTNPSYVLHVTDYASTNGNYPSLGYHAAGANFGIDIPGNVELAFGWMGGTPYGYWIQCRNGGALPLVLNPSGGRVGIGTMNPLDLLYVTGGSAIAPGGLPGNGIAAFGTGTGVALEIGGYPGGPYGNWLQSIHMSVAGNYYPLVLNPLGGGVCVNTTSPASAGPGLTVGGDISLYRPGNPTVGAIYFGTGNGIYIVFDGTRFNFTNQLAVPSLLVNGVPITGGGGGTINFNANGLQVGGGAFGTMNMGGSSNISISASYSGSGIGGSVSYVISQISDSRIKQNIVSLEGGLAIIDQLRPIRAEYNGLLGKRPGQPVVSVIAQELQAVIPEAVESISTVDGDFLSFDQMAITAHLILAVKQLKHKIEKLEARVN